MSKLAGFLHAVTVLAFIGILGALGLQQLYDQHDRYWATLLGLASLFWFMACLSPDVDVLPPLATRLGVARHSRATGIGLGIAVIALVASSRRFGPYAWAMLLGIVASVGMELRFHVWNLRAAKKLDTSLENVSSTIRRLEAADQEQLNSVIDTADFRSPRPFVVPPRKS
jgi:hypothetical protein